MKEQLSSNRTSMTVVGLVLLGAAGFAYSQGWFDWSHSGYEMEGDKVTTSQTTDQATTKEDVVHVTQQTTQPATKPAQ
jgi:hypothetical protein